MTILKIVLGLCLFVGMWCMGWHITVVVLAVLEVGYWLGFVNALPSPPSRY